MTTLTQINVTNDSTFLQNKRARLLISWLLAGAALTACGGGNDEGPPHATATAVPQTNTALAMESDTSVSPLTYGSNYHIKNDYSGARNTYLEGRRPNLSCEQLPLQHFG